MIRVVSTRQIPGGDLKEDLLDDCLRSIRTMTSPESVNESSLFSKYYFTL